MGSHLLEVLRQGVWASITGGWFHDPRQPIFTNTLHLYIWLLLLALPLTLYIYVASSFVIWSAYCGAIGGIFLIVKVLNSRFHYLFDTTEPRVDTLDDTVSLPNISNEEDSRTSKSQRSRAFDLEKEEETPGIEMRVMRTSTSGTRIPDLSSECSPPGVALRVDVHRMGSSCSVSSNGSNMDDGAARQKRKRSSRTSSNGATKLMDATDQSALVGEGVAQRSEGSNSFLGAPSGQSEQDLGADLSPASQGPSILSAGDAQSAMPSRRVVNVFSLDSGLEAKPEAAMLKETTSLEIGQLGSLMAEGSNLRRQGNFGNSDSAQLNSDGDRNSAGVASDSAGSNGIASRESVGGSFDSEPAKSAEALVQRSESVDPSDGESDDQIRSSTPLLSRSGSDPKKHQLSLEAAEAGVSGLKLRDRNEEIDSRQSDIVMEKKLVLIPQDDSLTGWNVPGGPYPSQWVLQAVNVAKSVMEPGATAIEIGDHNVDNVSLKSTDSQKSLGLNGIRRLFGSGSDVSSVDGNAHSDSRLSARHDRSSSDPAMRHPRTEKRRRGHRRNRAVDAEALYGTTWRSEREVSPRILERLLEESHEPNPVFGAACVQDEMDDPISANADGARPGTSHRRTNSRSGSLPNPFLQQAARDLRNHFRHRGPQTSLDITSSAVNERYPGRSGIFRQREDPVPGEIPNAPINSHRRLRRLAHSRREQRRREAPYGSPLAGPLSGVGPGTHVANSHEDTTDGAVHYFQDELGQWHSYTFAPSSGTITNPMTLGARRVPPPTDNVPSTSSPFSAMEPIDVDVESFKDADSCEVIIDPIPSSSNMKRPHGRSVKTPSSSESWTSDSSSELAIDPNTEKVYLARRRTHGSNNQSARSRDSGSGAASPMPSLPSLMTIAPELHTSGRLPLPNYASMQRSWQRNRLEVLQALTESLIERRRIPATYPTNNNGLSDYISQASSENEGLAKQGRHLNSHTGKSRRKQAQQYYLMKLIPGFDVKVWFDRLSLVAVFDRNLTIWESLLAVLLAFGTAILGSYLLHQGFYQELSVVLLCFIMASCQFSLLKSVQPDASSPTHGFNRVVAFSRPIYFCICAGLVYLLHTSLENQMYDKNLILYHCDLTNKLLLETLQEVILVMILFFPLMFSLGLFPQFNTFLMYCFEQLEMHCFGGNATCSLSAAIVALIRSLSAVGLLYGFAYGALCEPQKTQHILYSMFCAILIGLAYHISRTASDTRVFWSIIMQQFGPDEDCFGEASANTKIKEAEEQGDPLPKKLRDSVNARLKSDAIICSVICLISFGLHSSTVFTALQPSLTYVLASIAIVLGFFLHYLTPQFRKQMPCLVVAHPILKPGEFHQFEVRGAAKLMWFEKVFVFLCFLEKNVIYPLLVLSALTEKEAWATIHNHFGLGFGTVVIVITGLKALRTSYSDPSKHYLKLIFTLLFFHCEWKSVSESFLVDFFFVCIAFDKIYELWLKMQFVITYIAPWQITWGSAFHAFAQPFSVPHSAMLFLQALVSSIFSAPLNPFMGSAIFITSYVRPVKFWERDYNTKRVDHSNTRLQHHLEKNPGADDDNLNSIFYEHLTRSLQNSLCGDLALGRWGAVSQGDCFVLASDYLNCLVHIIEYGNGHVTFQVRGLEFRGTYCQQREVEAISEGVDDDDGCCWFDPGHLPHLLSVNAAFSQRWLAWEVTVTKYVLEGYSISDNSAVSMLQVFDLRKMLITYYVQSIIYYTVKADKLEEWLQQDAIVAALAPTLDKQYADLDPVFSMNIDEDYDYNVSGITRNSFCSEYYAWIHYCLQQREKNDGIDCSNDSVLVSLCFSLSILGRRALGVAAHSNSLASVEFFLYGLHALFKGDFRITSARDEWVFTDMDLLRKVVSPAVRMSLKLHQDHFTCPDEYDDHRALFDAISHFHDNLVISHEGDPAWRSSVLSGAPSLLALRHVLDDGRDEYKIIMLNKRHLSFRVIKLNRECVRGLWAGQQQELVYLRNRDPERGSIQNAKQALRNIINSSCDQPIGYPIYVSPLTTSYADTHPQLTALTGGPVSFTKIKDSMISLWRHIRRRCGEGCSSGSSAVPAHEETPYGHEGVYTASVLPTSVLSSGLNLSGSQSLDYAIDGSQLGGSVGRSSLTRGNYNRGSVASNMSGSFGKPSSSALAGLAGFLADTNINKEKESSRERDIKSGSLQRVRIVDANQVYDALNLGRRIDVIWPDESMRLKGGQSYWLNWVPQDGMEGVVVHKWGPGHRDPKCRSITDKTILLLKIDDKYVPIAETGVVDLGAEV